MRRLAAIAIGASVVLAPAMLAAASGAGATTHGDDAAASAPTTTVLATTTVPTTTVPATAVPVSTAPGAVATESGAAAPVPQALPSAALLQIPQGCPTPPVASVVFVGTMIAKVPDIARFRVQQIRAGQASAFIYGDLVDVHYANETQYLTVGDQYIVGAAPAASGLALSSKVRADAPLFGGNAVIGLTEKSSSCPPIEDPVRTLYVDGTEVDANLLRGLSTERREIALAFIKPVAAAFAIIIALVLVRWFLTFIGVAFRHAADAEPRQPIVRDRRHHQAG